MDIPRIMQHILFEIRRRYKNNTEPAREHQDGAKGGLGWSPRPPNYHKVNDGRSQIVIIQCGPPTNGQYLMTGSSSWTQAEGLGPQFSFQNVRYLDSFRIVCALLLTYFFHGMDASCEQKETKRATPILDTTNRSINVLFDVTRRPLCSQVVFIAS